MLAPHTSAGTARLHYPALVSQKLDGTDTVQMQGVAAWMRSASVVSADVQAASPEKAIAYVSFIPSAAKRDGLLQNEVMAMGLRSRWLHDYLNAPSEGPDDTPLRLSVVKSLLKKLKT